MSDAIDQVIELKEDVQILHCQHCGAILVKTGAFSI